MATNSTMPTPSSTEGEQFLCDDWFDPLENGVRTRIRGFIEELLEAELDAALGRGRYERPGALTPILVCFHKLEITVIHLAAAAAMLGQRRNKGGIPTGLETFL